jgi:flagella basal body P-ring formation protein FlgA
MSSVRGAIIALLAVVSMSECLAQSSKTSIRVQGHTDVVVSDSSVRLGDIAHIDSASINDDEAILRLRTLQISQSPKAGESTLLEGAQVLEKIKDNGIRLDTILYSLPRQIKITRAYREVTNDELEKALLSFLGSQDKQIDLKQIMQDKPVKIPTDSFGVEVVALHATKPGHFGVDYRSVSGSDEVRFQMRAMGDEWRLMPVAAKPLRRGAVISAADVQLRKVNAAAVLGDSVRELGDVIGKSAQRDVGEGEMFNTAAIATPPLVVAGSRVSMLFRAGRLEASAMGVALESGAERQEIKVRNDASNKIVTARVVDKGLVEVGGK